MAQAFSQGTIQMSALAVFVSGLEEEVIHVQAHEWLLGEFSSLLVVGLRVSVQC